MKTRIFRFSRFCVLGLLSACGGDKSDPLPPATTLEGGAPDGSTGPDPIGPHEIPLDASTGATLCAEMGTYCHPSDTGEANLGNTCHDVGHEGDPEACAEIYDQCMAFCLQDAGHNEDAGEAPVHDEVDSGAHDGG